MILTITDFLRLQKKKTCYNEKKCTFSTKRFSILGYTVERGEIYPNRYVNFHYLKTKKKNQSTELYASLLTIPRGYTIIQVRSAL